METSSYGNACWHGERAEKALYNGVLHAFVSLVGKRRRRIKSSCNVHVACVPSTAPKNAKNEIGEITSVTARSGGRQQLW
jgi:hypothetical protein